MADRLSENVTFWAVRAGMRLAIVTANVVPRPVIFAAAGLLARAGYMLFSGYRVRSTRNLTIALGDSLSASQIRRIVKRSLENFFYSFAEIPIGLATPPAQVCHEIPLQGREHLDAALAKGRGVILLSAHLGNFLILGSRLALGGYRTHVLINQPARGGVGRLLDEYRSQVLQTAIPARPRGQALRRLIDVLRQNEVVIIIADEYRRSGSGVRVPFFGRQVLARRGPATIALRTGAAIVPGYLIRGGNGRLTLTIEPELALDRTRGGNTAIAANTMRITRWLERTVRRYPDQWNWMTVHWHDQDPPLEASKNHHIEQLSH
jgi:KDO2-lipid IV(A) lauroyltransferase